jgi:hypothetical protein
MERENKTPVSQVRMTQTVEVLYQKLGNRWFAFSMINDEVFIGSLSQNEIETIQNNEEQNRESASAQPRAI